MALIRVLYSQTVSAIASCILGLLENPEVRKKAQEELGRVVKPGCLPDFDDQRSLPYITAVTKEALRWRVVSPMCPSAVCFVLFSLLTHKCIYRLSFIFQVAPRLLEAEQEYKGFRLPAGSMITVNIWFVACCAGI